MPRIAYLRIPFFQLTAHKRREGLNGQPFALITGKLTAGGYNKAHIFMCTSAAAHRGVATGMRLSEAKAVCADLVLHECDNALYANVQKHLAHQLISCSPKVSSHALGEFSLDASGLLHMGGENAFCHGVLQLCARAGFPDARIGIADSTFAALVATRLKNKLLFIVPPRQDTQFLAPLSIKYLDLDPTVTEVLLNLGIKSMGQLVELPPDSLIERFGEIGKWAYEYARGEDDRTPHSPEVLKEFECSIDMGGAISSLNQTMFALKALLDRLTSELQSNGLWAEELRLTFLNEDGQINDRVLPLIRPSCHGKFLLEVMKLSLESEPLHREFTKVNLCISRYSKQLFEQNQIAGVGTTDERSFGSSVVLLLQRFITRFGESKASKPVASDHYDLHNAGVWAPVEKENHSDAIIPINFEYLHKAIGAEQMSDFVLRKCTPRSQVMVELQDSIPSAINHHKIWYRVKEITVPEKLSGNWWEAASSNSYYHVLAEAKESPQVIALRDALMMLLVHDHRKNTWFIEGFFD